MIDEVCKFIAQCPHLAGRTVNVNYLDSRPGACSIESTGAVSVLKEYADGGRLCGAEFVFASREIYSKSAQDNTSAAELHEKVADWLEEQSCVGNLPQLSGGLVSAGIRIDKSGCIRSRGGLDARYEMRFTLIYHN